uniref:C2 domain-containing protein n=1 Tax=Salix viminalis TaxID=40686 RepID=A0A6N2LUZ7_SALVM
MDFATRSLRCVEYGGNKFRTRTCTDGGKNPTFQEKFVFTLIEGLREMTVAVWNSNTLTYDDFIGSGKIHLHKVLSQGFDDATWSLQTNTGRYAGEVRLIMHYANANRGATGYANSAPPYGAPVPQAQGAYYSQPPTAYPGSFPYPPPAYPPPPPATYPPAALKDTEWISRQDPYVCVEYASNKFRTRTCTDGGKNPTFQEKFVFTLIEGLREMTVAVWNSNTLTFDDFIGSGKIQLQKVLSQGFDDATWPLQSKTGRYSGEVRLMMHYANANRAATGYANSAPPYGAPVPQVSSYSAPPPAYGASYSQPPTAYPGSFPYPSYPPSSAYPPSAYPPPPPATYPPAPYAAPSAYPPQPYPPPPQASPYYPPGPFPGIYPPQY